MKKTLIGIVVAGILLIGCNDYSYEKFSKIYESGNKVYYMSNIQERDELKYTQFCFENNEKLYYVFQKSTCQRLKKHIFGY